MSEPVAPEMAVAIDRESNPAVYDRLMRLEEIRAEIDLLKEEAGQITYDLERSIEKSVLYTDDGGRHWRATAVRPDDTVLVDLPMVARLRPELYERITTVALDRSALNKALRAGAVDMEIAELAMTLRPNSPSIRLTRLDEEPDPAPREDDE